MNEELLYFIWKFRLYDPQLLTNLNQPVHVLKPGMQNMYSGPDFTNSQVKIDETTWAGNVEIHVKTSDWRKHQHDKDPAYDNIILHVVYEHDVELEELTFRKIPTIELKGKVEAGIIKRFEKFQNRNLFIPCEASINKVPEIVFESFLDRLLIERIELKSEITKRDLKETNGDWEEVLYRSLMRGFGFKANAEPMNQLARLIPVKHLWKHKHNPQEFYALLFGASGLLDKPIDDYSHKLLQIFHGLASKYSIQSLPKEIWKTSGIRPANFPSLRIAQAGALLLNNDNSLFSRLIDNFSIQHLLSLFNLKLDPYWVNHFVFGKEVKENKFLTPSKNMVDNLIINAIVPVLVLNASSKGDVLKKEKAIELLFSLSPDKNGTITKWNSLGIKSKNAANSQSLLHLKNAYCSYKKCLLCNVGGYLLKHDR